MQWMRERLGCFWSGHEPGGELSWQDWVGRPMWCVCCGLTSAEMTRWQRERFYGKAAIRAWNTEAMQQIAWDEQSAAMVGMWPDTPLPIEIILG